ncbi:MAG: EAL domain-containing protein [Gammaproteobacteria bacterium]|nr:EAL domain-containing protein [Gammaproteobacteria bacterium]
MESDLNQNDNNTLVLIEIENFEAITNVIGVAAADSLILKLSWHLQELDFEGFSQCRHFHLEDNLFALHGDAALSKNQVNKIASTVYHLMDKLDLKHQGESVPLLLRMGSVFNQPNAIVLVKMALTHAKNQNQTIVMYDEALDLPLYFRKYIQILNQISDALSNDRIQVYYQPIFDTHTGHVIKHEALARITDADSKITCSPDHLITCSPDHLFTCSPDHLIT